MPVLNFKLFHLIFVIGLSISNVACAKNNAELCNSSNVNKSLKCIQKENDILKNKLKILKNNEKNDYKVWRENIEKKCEGKKTYTLGEGAALIKEECYRLEYTNRLKRIYENKNTAVKEVKEINDDGLIITSLPYNSDDHVNCLLKNNKISCSKVNLINIVDLSRVYNFIDESNGASVIFPETEDGVILIASPSSSDSGKVLINLISINTFGLIKQISLDASKNVLISKNYEISYIKNGKLLKIILNKKGEFINK